MSVNFLASIRREAFVVQNCNDFAYRPTCIILTDDVLNSFDTFENSTSMLVQSQSTFDLQHDETYLIGKHFYHLVVKDKVVHLSLVSQSIPHSNINI